MTLPDPDFRDEDVTYGPDPYGRPLRAASVVIGRGAHFAVAETDAAALVRLRQTLSLPAVRMAIWEGHLTGRRK